METYTGIKFASTFIGTDFTADRRLDSLNRWVYILGELGLAPVHSQGAYGNHSYRDGDEAFVITRTGMVPSRDLVESDYCRVCYNQEKKRFDVEGKHQPSSECFLHHHIYSNDLQVNTIMHGHSSLLIEYAEELGIPQTPDEHPYGTIELAESALTIMRRGGGFFIMKNHGFVAAGPSIDSTAGVVLHHFMKLLDHLQ